LFLNPTVTDPETLEIKWSEPDVEGLGDFLVKEKGLSEERVRAGAARLSKGLKTKPQGTQVSPVPLPPFPPPLCTFLSGGFCGFFGGGRLIFDRTVGRVFQGFAKESRGACKAEEKG
jgi:hypothetical protein